MGKRTVILLPREGNPVTRVWLPPSRDIRGLVVKAPSWSVGYDVRKHCKALGVAVFAPVGEFASLDLIVWVAWVQPGEQPRGLQAVAASEARRDPTLARILDTLDQRLGCVSG